MENLQQTRICGARSGSPQQDVLIAEWHNLKVSKQGREDHIKQSRDRFP